MFPKVKNVNVESLKIGSKMLDFFGSLPQPLPKGKGFSKAYPQPLPKGKGFSISPLMPIYFLINSV